MTKLWKHIAIGAAVAGSVALAGYFWMPARMAFASMMGGNMAAMMEGHMKGGNMPAMMDGHMKDGNMMSGMMDGHMKDGNMAAMMQSHMQDPNHAAMMESHMQDPNHAAMMESHMKDGTMGAMMEMMMSSGMMANMDKMHEAMAPMHQQELEAAARVLGMTAADLTQALAGGKTADVLAQERSIDPALITSVVAEVRKAAFAELVKAGTLTQEQADKMLEQMNKVGFATLNCQSPKAPTN